jgi:hypothetical protein
MKRLSFLLLALPLAVTAGDNLLRKATQALEKKDIVTANDACLNAVKANPGDPNTWYTLGVVRWVEVYQTPAAERQKLKARLREGHEALDKALQLEPNFGDAMLYKSLMYRLDAEMAGSPEAAKPFIVRADELMAKAIELKKSGKWKDGSPDVPPPPPAPPAPKA